MPKIPILQSIYEWDNFQVEHPVVSLRLHKSIDVHCSSVSLHTKIHEWELIKSSLLSYFPFSKVQWCFKFSRTSKRLERIEICSYKIHLG